MTSSRTWGAFFDPHWGVRRKMAALPLPVAILGDLICGNRKWGHPRWPPEAEGPPFSSSLLNGDRKTRPILLLPIPCKFCTFRFLSYSPTRYRKVRIDLLMANTWNPDFCASPVVNASWRVVDRSCWLNRALIKGTERNLARSFSGPISSKLAACLGYRPGNHRTRAGCWWFSDQPSFHSNSSSAPSRQIWENSHISCSFGLRRSHLALKWKSGQAEVGFCWGAVTGIFHVNFSSMEAQKCDSCWFYLPQMGGEGNTFLANLEKQKSNFGCRAARNTKEAKFKNSKTKFKNSKTKSAFLNRNRTLLYIPMTITMNINIFINKIMSLRCVSSLWASYQICKIVGCACAGNAGVTFSPPPRVSDPDMYHGTCMTHVTWCMPGSLSRGFLWSRWENVPGIPGACPIRNFTYLVRGPLATITSIPTPSSALNQPTNTLLCRFNSSLTIPKMDRTKGTIC